MCCKINIETDMETALDLAQELKTNKKVSNISFKYTTKKGMFS